MCCCKCAFVLLIRTRLLLLLLADCCCQVLWVLHKAKTAAVAAEKKTLCFSGGDR